MAHGVFCATKKKSGDGWGLPRVAWAASGCWRERCSVQFWHRSWKWARTAFFWLASTRRLFLEVCCLVGCWCIKCKSFVKINWLKQVIVCSQNGWRFSNSMSTEFYAKEQKHPKHTEFLIKMFWNQLLNYLIWKKEDVQPTSCLFFRVAKTKKLIKSQVFISHFCVGKTSRNSPKSPKVPKVQTKTKFQPVSTPKFIVGQQVRDLEPYGEILGGVELPIQSRTFGVRGTRNAVRGAAHPAPKQPTQLGVSRNSQVVWMSGSVLFRKQTKKSSREWQLSCWGALDSSSVLGSDAPWSCRKGIA